MKLQYLEKKLLDLQAEYTACLGLVNKYEESAIELNDRIRRVRSELNELNSKKLKRK